ncbi:cytochrome P450 [Rhizopogon salebrosus TDB-379]|nr:cytochrome P450 [Rhizopogon salebrosus TDB-379]
MTIGGILSGRSLGVIVRAYLAKSDSGLPLPPSPSNSRLLGHFLPVRSPFLTIAGWIDNYGPLITICSGTERIAIIGRHKAAVDIMEKQGGSVADRPRMIAAGEIFRGGQSLAFAPVGERFRLMRRALHTHLQHKVAEEYQPLQIHAAATIMKVAYGKNTPTVATDPEVVEIRQITETIVKVPGSGNYLVDLIPWLKYLPWYGQELRRGYEKSERLNTSQLNHVRQQIQTNEDVGPSFAKYMLENGHLYGLTETEMAFLAGSFFAGGSDTVSVAIYTQAKVQAELDDVIGRHRVPTFADQHSLPYLQAFISEALRWRPLTPSGVAHKTNRDVIWGGYCIPAGTTVYGNHCAISRDPEVFPEPNEFKLQRRIDNDGNLRGDLKFFVYGFGRRVCPGQHVANRSVFITSLLILWGFRLILDFTEPLGDMAFINRDRRPCSIRCRTRVPETELRRIMEQNSEVA